jgi:hypothetical protein
MLIEFVEDFATKKKGDVWDCTNSLLAAKLINQKVAKKRERLPKTKKKKKAE